MANPQPTDAHLRIAHSIEEQIMVSLFSEREFRALLFILRLSWGCGKHSALIPKQSDFTLAGIGETHIKACLDWLINARVIFRNMDRYQFNKNYDEWKVSRARLYDAEKLAKLVNLNINSPDNSITEEVPDKVTSNLLKRELSGYLKSNSSEAEPASFKENLNKNINKYKYLNSFWVNLLTGEAVSAAEAFPGEAAELWNKTLADLKTQVNQANYRIWLEKTEGLGYLGSDFLVRAGSSLIAGYLDANLRAIMEAALARTAGQAYRIELIEIADNGTLGADQVNATYPNYSKLEGKK